MEALLAQIWLIVLILAMFVLGFKLVRLSTLKQDLAAYESELRSLRAKLARQASAPELPTNIDGTDLPALINTLAPHLPNWLKPLVGNPAIVNNLADYAKKNPEQIKGFLGNLTGGAAKQTDNNTGIAL